VPPGSISVAPINRIRPTRKLLRPQQHVEREKFVKSNPVIAVQSASIHRAELEATGSSDVILWTVVVNHGSAPFGRRRSTDRLTDRL